MVNNNLTLVLNADDTVLNVTSAYRAFNIVYKGKATIVSHEETNPFICEQEEFKRPTIIRLKEYVYIPYRKSLPLTKQNIYRRDGNQCAYCPSNKKLTIDHIQPKSRGGLNTWENLVTCCMRCNRKKDNKTPAEAGMELRVKPTKPSYQLIVTNPNAHIHWVDYFSNTN